MHEAREIEAETRGLREEAQSALWIQDGTTEHKEVQG